MDSRRPTALDPKRRKGDHPSDTRRRTSVNASTWSKRLMRLAAILPPICSVAGHEADAICTAGSIAPFVVLAGYGVCSVVAIDLARRMHAGARRRRRYELTTGEGGCNQARDRSTTHLMDVFFACLVVFSCTRGAEIGLLLPASPLIDWPAFWWLHEATYCAFVFTKSLILLVQAQTVAWILWINDSERRPTATVPLLTADKELPRLQSATRPTWCAAWCAQWSALPAVARTIYAAFALTHIGIFGSLVVVNETMGIAGCPRTNATATNATNVTTFVAFSRRTQDLTPQEQSTGSFNGPGETPSLTSSSTAVLDSAAWWVGCTSLLVAVEYIVISTMAFRAYKLERSLGSGVDIAMGRIGLSSLLYGMTFALRALNNFVTLACPAYARFFCSLGLLDMLCELMVCEIMPSMGVLWLLYPAFASPELPSEPTVPSKRQAHVQQSS